MTALQVSLPQPRSFTGQLPTLSIGSESRAPVNAELGGLQTQFDGSSLFSISLGPRSSALSTLPAAPQRTDS